MKKVLVGGSFDIVHPGHIELLEKARSYGDYLVVMIPTDQRIHHKKHPALPVFPQDDRARIIGALKVVDEVVIVHEDPSKPISVKGLKLIKPDVYVRTSEVNPQSLAEEVAVCKDLHIDIVILDRQPGSKYRSSSRVVEYILSNFSLKEMKGLINKDE